MIVRSVYSGSAAGEGEIVRLVHSKERGRHLVCADAEQDRDA